MPRFYCPVPLATGTPLDLPPDAARHVQVLRLQPGHAITLFNGAGGEWDARVTRMGRSDVQVAVGAHHAVEREAVRAVHLLAGISANERMDWLMEKAAELGAASLTPLLAERSVLKLKGERAGKKLAHWRAVASAACEQCGRNRVPPIHDAQSLAEWLASEDGRAAPPDAPVHGTRLLLSLRPDARRLAEVAAGGGGPVTLLSGPEGGLTSTEEAAALAAGFLPVTLGPRVLRAETAPLAVLAALTL
ncbi:16S rRNA (uracil(1498)-N(3))-methyltransferase [Polaromonas sp. C04]|uniref:16S rRNA (uracil(1498)-N(3))-methyltransferase n=1 Tax=Polaromonas sp. C04 TaxID=1945857 RepID=UPI0009841766|nr:16S rRNA (uracil(1498)-N(3))-methyltransferase [Polaromonas sp. C04]OOG54718.1 16S rRNA (uracil(1498)-N(3))-methyltransferase [Polaromonas sp. C04]